MFKGIRHCDTSVGLNQNLSEIPVRVGCMQCHGLACNTCSVLGTKSYRDHLLSADGSLMREIGGQDF